MRQILFYSAVAVFGLVYAGEPDELQVPCTISSILHGRQEETSTCNLKMLLLQQMQVSRNEVGMFQRPLVEKKNIFPLETCDGAGSVCRARGRRTCICPSSFVCDPFDNRVHICVKLRYLAQMEEMR